jgi:predicted 2-oxoglutarate/Fe(II)-dependent dioxygenase YbiX
MQINRLGAGVFTIDAFLSTDECTTLIVQSEKRGYSEAAIRTEDGERLYKDARNNDRMVFDDHELAATLYQRACPLLPQEIDGWAATRFNERWRYYRYDRDQQFTWHLDGTVRLGTGEESILTFMIYLNDDFEGGSTDFGWESVKPSRGMALVFPHRLRHQGSAVKAGLKYVLRTDVMYAEKPA